MPDCTAAEERFAGQPCLRLQWGPQDSVLVALHGAHVLSWIAGGRERLYLSPTAVFDGKSAIRGGVPVCFPQFNERGPLPKHGFARNLSWTPGRATSDEASGDAVLELQLVSNPATQAAWPGEFQFNLRLTLGPNRLQMDLAARNTGTTPWSFTGALHTYLRVEDISAVQLDGLDGQPCWDALADTRSTHAGTVRFDGEFDRVFRAAPGPLVMRDGASALQITQSDSFADTVVWNPGQAKQLADLPAGGYAHMLCVEAAQVDQPLTLAPGASWSGWQRLALA
jgi:glucose-6-phosphate 1-epimerase